MFPVQLDEYYTNFDDWLDIATTGLSESVKSLLIEDMREHYAEAVHVLIAGVAHLVV